MSSEDGFVAGVEAAATREGFALDAAQHRLLDRLATLGAGVVQSDAPRSLYIHGEAGRGKSWLAGAVAARLPAGTTTRVHFHAFFDDLHRRIHEHWLQRDAVENAIDDVLGDSRLLFFDELHVHDTGDARLLTRLLDHVFARGLAVLATSNYAPRDLLPDPVWHHVFEPGIALIEAHADVWHLTGPVDYRTVTESRASGFASGSWTATPHRSAAPGATSVVEVRGRTFAVTSAQGGELVATFDQLCGAATSPIEYLAWARAFPRWAVTDIPPFGEIPAPARQRLVNLVDVVVDADVPVRFFSTVDLHRFIADAAGPPDVHRMASRLHLLDSRKEGRPALADHESARGHGGSGPFQVRPVPSVWHEDVSFR